MNSSHMQQMIGVLEKRVRELENRLHKPVRIASGGSGSAELPVGQEQFTAWVVVAMNTMAFDYPGRLHPPLTAI